MTNKDLKEIGSVFPLDSCEIASNTLLTKKDLISFLHVKDNVIFLSLGREAFSLIARKHPQNKKVLLPSYTCQTVCDPFVQLNWNFDIYSIGINLRINIENVREQIKKFNPAVMVLHPYYGTDFTPEEIELIKEVKGKGVITVVDYTQSIYCNKHIEFADYCVGSLRKWIDCPDGGYIYSNTYDLTPFEPFDNHILFVQPQIDSMYLRGEYFKTNNFHLKNISIRLNKQAVKNADYNIQPHSISSLGMNRLLNSPFFANAEIRYSNYKYLHNNIIQSLKIKFVYEDMSEIISAPLYFPIYCNNRSELQRRLAESNVYAPILWKVPEYYQNLNNSSLYIYDHILVIPVDQRYGIKEMQRICDVINAF